MKSSPKSGLGAGKRRKETPLELASAVFIFIILVLFPLLPGTQGYVNLTETKYILFKVFTLLYLGVCLLLFVRLLFLRRDSRSLSARFDWKKPDLPQLLLTAYALWGVVCAIVSPYSGLWEGQSRYEGVLSLLLYAAIFLLLSFLGEYRSWYSDAITVMSLIFVGISLLQLLGVPLIYPDGYNYANSGFISTIGNVDCVSGLIAILFPFLAGVYVIAEGKKRSRISMLIAAALLLFVGLKINVESGKFGILAAFLAVFPFMLTERRRRVRVMFLLSGSLAAFGLHKLIAAMSPLRFRLSFVGLAALVLAAALLLLGRLCAKRKAESKLAPRSILLIGFGAELALLIVGVIFVFCYGGTNVTLQEFHDLLHGSLGDYVGNNRGFVWKACWELGKTSPIFGCGPGAFSEAFSPYNRVDVVHVVFDFAHNDYLQILVCTGFVGLALYCAFLISVFVRAYRRILQNPLLIALLSASVGFLAHVFFSFSIAILSPIFWVIMGMLNAELSTKH